MLMNSALEEPAPQRVLSVSELTQLVKDLIEGSLPAVWVAGEIADLARPQSGHVYFTLKDAGAQLPAALWRSAAARVRFDLHDGLEVVCRGRLEVYAPRGRYQLIVEEVQPRGIGALELALRQLRDRLGREGLFDPARKRPLPPFPRRVAVITSPTGAALRDFLEVLRRRWHGVDVLVIPSRVQGEGAAEELAAALALANRLTTTIDCLVLTRGGGSLEDLWAFNEEVLVRAICASRLPVVSGVGHEIDVTLADLAADVRALTPSDAAARVVPAAEEIGRHVHQLRARLAAAIRARVAAARGRWETLASHRALSRPAAWVHDLARRVDELESRALYSIRQCLRHAGQVVEAVAGRLDSLSPLAVLGRGYSVTQRVRDGHIVRDAAELSIGEAICTQFARGRATSRVEGVEGK
jgi:exodeoxyribonuclease VII large subunit